MAPLASNLTSRGWLKYTSMGVQHEYMVRLAAGSTSADYIGFFGLLAGILKAHLPTSDGFISARYSAAGSLVSFPIAWSAVAGTLAVSVEQNAKPQFQSLVGRSADGVRCKHSFYAPYPETDSDYRFSLAAASAFQDWIDLLDETTPAVVSASGQPVIWQEYVNAGFNAYWQRNVRP